MRNAIIVGMICSLLFSHTGVWAADPPVAPPQNKTVEKAYQWWQDPTGWALTTLATYLTTKFFTSWKQTVTKFKEEIAELEKAKAQLRVDAREWAEQKKAYEEMIRIFETEILPRSEQLPKLFEQILAARRARWDFMKKLEGRLEGLGLKKTFGSHKEFQEWLKTEEGKTARGLKPEWFTEHDELRKQEHRNMRTLMQTFNEMALNVDKATPPDFQRLTVHQQSHGSFLLFRNGAARMPVTASALVAQSEQMMEMCRRHMEASMGIINKDKENIKSKAVDNKLRGELLTYQNYAKNFRGTLGWGLAALVASAYPAYLTVDNLFFKKKEPPAVVVKPRGQQLVTTEEVVKSEPFVSVVEEVLKKNKATIMKSLRENLTDEEMKAIDNGELDLDSRVAVLEGQTKLDIMSVRSAIRNGLENLADRHLKENQKYDEFLKKLQIADMDALPPAEKNAKLRELITMLTPFYNKVLDGALSSVHQDAHKRIGSAIVEKLISDTIEELKTKKWGPPGKPPIPGQVSLRR